MRDDVRDAIDDIADQLDAAEEAERSAQPLSGKRVAFAGKLGGVTRREAMQLVRQLGAVAVDSLESGVDLVVIGAEESPLAEAELLGDAVRAQAARGETEIIHETDFWQRLGLVEAEQSIRRLHTPAMLAHLLSVSVRVIRRWHRRGLIVPARTVHKLPYFDFTEVATARRLAELVAAGASPEAIERRLEQLSEVLPDVERPLAQLSVLIEGKQILLRQGEGLIEPGGQLRIDFDAIEAEATQRHTEPRAEVLSIAGREATGFPIEQEPAADEDPLLQHAYAAEDDGDLENAVHFYHAILGRDGARADMCFQLAELLYRIGQVDAARERYYMAIELDEAFVEARASLGSVLAEAGQKELAIAAFEGALLLHDEYPDVHYNLARTLDEVGRSDEAESHWRRFLQLSPDSPWADEARERLDES